VTDKLKRVIRHIIAHCFSMGSRKLRKLCYNRESLVADLNPSPHKYVPGVLTTQL
jgi:hypothetical protein